MVVIQSREGCGFHFRFVYISIEMGARNGNIYAALRDSWVPISPIIVAATCTTEVKDAGVEVIAIINTIVHRNGVVSRWSVVATAIICFADMHYTAGGGGKIVINGYIGCVGTVFIVKVDGSASVTGRKWFNKHSIDVGITRGLDHRWKPGGRPFPPQAIGRMIVYKVSARPRHITQKRRKYGINVAERNTLNEWFRLP